MQTELEELNGNGSISDTVIYIIRLWKSHRHRKTVKTANQKESLNLLLCKFNILLFRKKKVHHKNFKI